MPDPTPSPAPGLSPAAVRALLALRKLTLSELHAIEVYHLRKIKQGVARRMAERANARAAAREGVPPLALVPPPESGTWADRYEDEAIAQGQDGPDALARVYALQAESAALVWDGEPVSVSDPLPLSLVGGDDEDDDPDATPLEVTDADPRRWGESPGGPVS